MNVRYFFVRADAEWGYLLLKRFSPRALPAMGDLHCTKVRIDRVIQTELEGK